MGVIRSPLTTKSNIDTQNDAMFERKDVFLQGPSFWVSMLILDICIYIYTYIYILHKRGLYYPLIPTIIS